MQHAFDNHHIKAYQSHKDLSGLLNQALSSRIFLCLRKLCLWVFTNTASNHPQTCCFIWQTGGVKLAADAKLLQVQCHYNKDNPYEGVSLIWLLWLLENRRWCWTFTSLTGRLGSLQCQCFDGMCTRSVAECTPHHRHRPC